jgi:hypothetical protein
MLALSVYRLDPINFTDPCWQASSVKELLFVGANNDNAAREFAAQKTTMMVPRARFPAKLHSPWLDAKITSCGLETSKHDVAEGQVVTASGRPLPT